tara:strand:+ start:337 stop:540 length:204 start_codon:yes stop_codon:yes gene_type:complete
MSRNNITIARQEDLTKEELEKLGREISQTCLWSGDDIITVFQSALEDANFHSFNELVSVMWRGYNER